MESKNNLRIQIEQLFQDNPEKFFGVSEIARQLNARRNTIHYHLKTLKAKSFLGQNSEGEYYLVTAQANHYANKEDLTLGKRFKHVYTAFLVSNFVPVVQAWLGIEYSKLSNDLGELGAQNGSIDESKASVLFRKASQLTFVLFICIIVYVVFFVLSNVYHNTVLSSSIIILTTILACGNNIILRKAWINISTFFMARGEISSSMPTATNQVARVSKGVNRSIVSWVLFIITYSVLIPMINIYTTYSSISEAFDNVAIFAILMVLGFLFLIGAILVLIGIVDQAFGIFGLSKALQAGTS